MARSGVRTRTRATWQKTMMPTSKRETEFGVSCRVWKSPMKGVEKVKEGVLNPKKRKFSVKFSFHKFLDSKKSGAFLKVFRKNCGKCEITISQSG